MVALVCMALALLPLLLGCVTVRPEVSVTPAPVPAELQGAGWDRFPVSYCVVRDGEASFVPHDRFVELAEAAFAEWRDGLVYEGVCPGPPEEGNGRNEISWGQLEGPEAPLNEAGLTRLLYRQSPLASTAEIIEADIVLDNDPPRRLANQDCLYATLLHEAGHFLGIHHIAPPAVMAPVVTDCRAELTEADRSALAEIYKD